MIAVEMTMLQTTRLRFVMEIHWLWPVCPDGYELKTMNSGRKAVIPRSIRQRLKDVFLFPELWREFLATKPTDSNILQFTSKYGVLEHYSFSLKQYRSLDYSHRIFHAMMLERWRKHQSGFITFKRELEESLQTSDRLILIDANLNGYWQF